jgi:SAM-dependent methyltransferase
MSGYLLVDRAGLARQRIAALSELFDPWTFRHLQGVGLGAGWRCWEVGAGSGAVPRWLSEQVGPGGQVIATDLDVTWAGELDGSGVEVRRHDVAADAPPDRGLDLIHARLVLVHVHDRKRALANMIGALRPGGWLVIEDADPMLQPLGCLESERPEQVLANRLRDGFRRLLAARDVDLAYGRKLPRLLREAGLAGVRADSTFPVAAPAGAELELATVRLLADQLIEIGCATRAEIDQHLETVASGALDLATSPLVTAWGQRPLI